MDGHNTTGFGLVPENPADFGSLPNASESFRIVPNASEAFRTVPHDSEGRGNVQNISERKENHTLTVREAARLFESAGVARTERSIVNWCQLNAQGVARLDAYFDPNERKYFITPQSVELAIQEERAKAARGRDVSETVGIVPKDSEGVQETKNAASTKADSGRISELEKENLDLKITNRGKDFFIEQLQKEREGFARERGEYVEKLMRFNRRVGELETKLLQLGAPRKEHDRSNTTPENLDSEAR